jgi:ribosomal protein L16
LLSHDQRVSAKHFQIAIDTLKKRLRGYAYTIYPRVVTNIAVYTSGNEQRMGKGKGSFDYWAARIAHGRVVLEIGGEVHEQVVREALRIAGNKLPGKWEFVTKGDGPVMGTTRWDQDNVSRQELFNPKREQPLHPLHKLADGSRAGESEDKTAIAV